MKTDEVKSSGQESLNRLADVLRLTAIRLETTSPYEIHTEVTRADLIETLLAIADEVEA